MCKSKKVRVFDCAVRPDVATAIAHHAVDLMAQAIKSELSAYAATENWDQFIELVETVKEMTAAAQAAVAPERN